MNNLFSFVAGIAVGATAAWLVFRYKQTQKIEDEFEIIEAETDTPEETTDYREETEETGMTYDDNDGLVRLRLLIADCDYDPLVDDGKDPFTIPPEEFGQLEDYRQISLMFYADEILADTDDAALTDEEVEIATGGYAWVDTLGEYDDSTVYIRNDRLKCDLEIDFSARKYYM